MRKKKIGSRKSPSGRSRGGTAHKAKSAKPGRHTASLIVGIGASAGGLGAFKPLFSNMPPDSGVTFVLVQHLAPDHKSLLAALIGKVTAMPVIEAENDTAEGGSRSISSMTVCGVGRRSRCGRDERSCNPANPSRR
jgi:chemotaxis response regulator CheB